MNGSTRQSRDCLSTGTNQVTVPLQQQFEQQKFLNGYELVDGEAMHAAHGNRFQVPPDVLKQHIQDGHFVEVRVDSPRFSIHEDDVAHCTCPSCHGEMSKPVLSHDEPSSLVLLPKQDVPSRGWGEDFWVKISGREGHFLRGIVDNPLIEARLHGLHLGDEIFLELKHVLAVHGSHRQEMVLAMSPAELKQLVLWLGSMND